jgi:hypothetical protein
MSYTLLLYHFRCIPTAVEREDFLMDAKRFSNSQHSIDDGPRQHGVRDEPKLVDLICALLKLPCAGVNRINFNEYSSSLDPLIFHVPDLFDDLFQAILLEHN